MFPYPSDANIYTVYDPKVHGPNYAEYQRIQAEDRTAKANLQMLWNKIEGLEKKMSGITNWCSQGSFDITVRGEKITVPGHPFSADDENAEIVTRTKRVKNEQTGRIENFPYEMHLCGNCMKAYDPYNEHQPTDKIKALEAWQEGYEEGQKANPTTPIVGHE